MYLTLHPLLLLLIYVNRNQDITLELLFIAAGSAIFSVGLLRCLAAWILARGEVRNSGATFILYVFAQLGWLIYLNYIQVRARGSCTLCCAAAPVPCCCRAVARCQVQEANAPSGSAAHPRRWPARHQASDGTSAAPPSLRVPGPREHADLKCCRDACLRLSRRLCVRALEATGPLVQDAGGSLGVVQGLKGLCARVGVCRVQVMGHCQAMLGMNAWVPTVRESGSRDNLHLLAAMGAKGDADIGLKGDGGVDPARPEAALECGPFAGRTPRPRPDPAESYAANAGNGDEVVMASNGMYGVPDENVRMERVQEAVSSGTAPGLYDGSSSVGTGSF